jgi:hypothetical protein
LALHVANEALAFGLELAMLAAIGWWGFESGPGRLTSALLGVGAPLAMACVWGVFAAPKARIRLPMAGVLVVKGLAFGAGAAAILALGHRGLAASFAAVAAVNTAVATVDRDAAMRSGR